MSKFKVGQRVWWNDPDGGESSAEYIVHSVNETSDEPDGWEFDAYFIVNEWSETEVYEHELEVCEEVDDEL